LDLKLFANLSFLAILLLASVSAVIGYAYSARKWIFFSKPLIITILLLFYVMNSRQVYPLIVIALIFAFLGDFFLMWQKNLLLFLAGLLSYIMMFILFIVFIVTFQVRLPLVYFSAESIVMGFVYLLLGTLLFFLLFRYTRSFKFLVIIFLLLILIVSYFCYLNVKVQMSEIAYVQYLGSLLFIISGKLLLMDFFRKPVRYGGVYISITFIVAQLFMLAGIMNI
jgi:hypothetical protein